MCLRKSPLFRGSSKDVSVLSKGDRAAATQVVEVEVSCQEKQQRKYSHCDAEERAKIAKHACL